MNVFIVAVNQPIGTSVFTLQKRLRSHVNVQKPRPPHHRRGIVEKFITPFISNPDTHKPWVERCTNILANKKTVGKIENPYEKIIARECLNWFKSSQMVGIFHTNSIKAEEEFEFAVPLKRANMYLKGYQPSILDLALKGTAYEALLQLVQRKNRIGYFVFSQETNATKLFNISRKTPQVILIGKLCSLRL